MIVIDASDEQLVFLGTFKSTEIERDRLLFLGYPIYDELTNINACLPSEITQIIIFIRNANSSCNIDPYLLKTMLDKLGCGEVENPFPPDDSEGGFCVGA